jgi:hypothetical protein
MSTAPSYLHAELIHFRKRRTEQGCRASPLELKEQLRSEIEPAHRLCALCREVASPKFGRLELIAFSLLGVFASAVTIFSFAELFYVISSGALEQTVQALLAK